ncbi:hypothetical protein BB560_007313 [Smittium megazygosporum]|uniref:Uncharacterized protein n=1 Tax=Smittium megazygosporum TaxID=133381 RepID=A0A2T9XWX6_9FUNG|nr:hypothetical protein BB560_007313 [Smittium megazygosporum]
MASYGVPVLLKELFTLPPENLFSSQPADSDKSDLYSSSEFNSFATTTAAASKPDSKENNSSQSHYSIPQNFCIHPKWSGKTVRITSNVIDYIPAIQIAVLSFSLSSEPISFDQTSTLHSDKDSPLDFLHLLSRYPQSLFPHSFLVLSDLLSPDAIVVGHTFMLIGKIFSFADHPLLENVPKAISSRIFALRPTTISNVDGLDVDSFNSVILNLRSNLLSLD